jgi:serine/threonine-protein phosphatase 6 regulatory ankyrin repeat subunit A
MKLSNTYILFAGRTPLHMCCLGGFVECCRKFLQVGIDLDAQDNTGKTPLHLAAFKG